MSEAVVREKDPRLVEAGRRGMRSRWGPRRVLRLDTLPSPVRAAIEAMVNAEQAAREREAADNAA